MYSIVLSVPQYTIGGTRWCAIQARMKLYGELKEMAWRRRPPQRRLQCEEGQVTAPLQHTCTMHISDLQYTFE